MGYMNIGNINHQAKMSQAKELFNAHKNNPQELIKHLKGLASDGNEAGLKVFCNQMKAHGLDENNDYDKLCSGAKIIRVRCFYT